LNFRHFARISASRYSSIASNSAKLDKKRCRICVHEAWNRIFLSLSKMISRNALEIKTTRLGMIHQVYSLTPQLECKSCWHARILRNLQQRPTRQSKAKKASLQNLLFQTHSRLCLLPYQTAASKKAKTSRILPSTSSIQLSLWARPRFLAISRLEFLPSGNEANFCTKIRNISLKCRWMSLQN